MKYLNDLLFASFVLFAILHQVQALPEHCKYWQDYKEIDYCNDFGEAHLGCKNNGKWKKSCGSIEPKISISKDLKNTILKTHNMYRSIIAKGHLSNVPIASRMFKLHWDNNLAKIAKFILKRCSLDHPGKDIGAPNAKHPGFNAAYSMFPIDEDQDIKKVLKSHLKKWYDQYEYINYNELSTDYSPPGKETSHFKQLAVGLNSRIGCAMGKFSKKRWMYQMTVCVYGCKKFGGEKPYFVGKIPGEDCECGVGDEFKSLCNDVEHVEDCGNCGGNSSKCLPALVDAEDEEDIRISSAIKPRTGTNKLLQWIMCIKGLINCDKNKGKAQFVR